MTYFHILTGQHKYGDCLCIPNYDVENERCRPDDISEQIRLGIVPIADNHIAEIEPSNSAHPATPHPLSGIPDTSSYISNILPEGDLYHIP